MRSPWAGLGLLVVAGAADALSVLSRTTIVQTRTPDALLGPVAPPPSRSSDRPVRTSATCVGWWRARPPVRRLW
ncbi:hypothetical protein SALBM217S_08334 [Streptomyces griseoloalbus]